MAGGWRIWELLASGKLIIGGEGAGELPGGSVFARAMTGGSPAALPVGAAAFAASMTPRSRLFDAATPPGGRGNGRPPLLLPSSLLIDETVSLRLRSAAETTEVVEATRVGRARVDDEDDVVESVLSRAAPLLPPGEGSGRPPPVDAVPGGKGARGPEEIVGLEAGEEEAEVIPWKEEVGIVGRPRSDAVEEGGRGRLDAIAGELVVDEGGVGRSEVLTIGDELADDDEGSGARAAGIWVGKRGGGGITATPGKGRAGEEGSGLAPRGGGADGYDDVGGFTLEYRIDSLAWSGSGCPCWGLRAGVDEDGGGRVGGRA